MHTNLYDTILQGDVLDVLRGLPDGCVQTCVTSPPYWKQRDYGVPGQIGLEPTPQEYVARLVEVFREVRRVLRSDGTCWINLGDSYYAHNGTRGNKSDAAPDNKWPNAITHVHRAQPVDGLKPKDACGIPWMVAFALRDDGWWLRSDIVWAKSNPMPESVTDRPTKSHEYIFLLSKSQRYYYDAEAIREPVTGGSHPRTAGRNSRKYVDRDPAHLRGVTPKSAKPGSGIKANASFHAAVTDLVPTRNKRTVWTVATAPYAEAHFATFPPKLITPCILAGSAAKACETCGAPWRRVTSKSTSFEGGSGKAGRTAEDVNAAGKWAGKQYGKNLKLGPVVSVTTQGWQPTCRCEHNTGSAASLVLDPFMGSGSTGYTARLHSRHYLGIELNSSYIEMADRRIGEAKQPHLWTA